MATIPQVAAALEQVLGPVADEAGRTSGFVRRAGGKLTGATFVQTLVLGWLEEPNASLSRLTQTAQALGVALQPPSLHARFTEAAATCLRQVLEAGVGQVIAGDAVAIPLLARFPGVYVQDSSTLGLPDELAGVWAGCGGGDAAQRGAQAAVKVQVRLDLRTGALHGPCLQPGRAPDQGVAAARLPHPLPKGALQVRDLGYFSLDALAAETAAGRFWLTRLHPQTACFDADGQRLDLPVWLRLQTAAVCDVSIQVGVRQRVPARLLAVRVPQEVADQRRRRLYAAAREAGRTPNASQLALAGWTLLLTNVPCPLLSVPEALALARARWQIELLFKLWKAHGQLATSRSARPWRRLCECYAKLLAMLVQHWLLLTALWRFPDHSLPKAAGVVRAWTRPLAAALAGALVLHTVLALIAQNITAGTRIDPRRTHPNTYQLLLDPGLLA